MIPFIRSLSELMAITESREGKKNLYNSNESYSLRMDSIPRKEYRRSIEKEEVDLPNLPKTIRHKLIKNKKYLSKFID